MNNAMSESSAFKAQTAEFNAFAECSNLWRSQPGIVSDDYPAWRSKWEGAFHRLLEAAKANQRIEFAMAGAFRDITKRQAFYMTQLSHQIHLDNVKAGWWAEHFAYGGSIPDRYFIPTKLCMAHSEISEGLEGERKGLKDDKLPQHDMLAVEIADCIIRLLDIAGYRGYDIGKIIQEKRAFNAVREDHKQETRSLPGGKVF